MQRMKKKSFDILRFAVPVVSLFIFLVCGNILVKEYFSIEQRVIINPCLMWAILLLLFLYCRYFENRDIQLHGKSQQGILFSLSAIFAVSILTLCVIFFVFSPLYALGIISKEVSPVVKSLVPIYKEQPLLLLFSCVTAGVTEEYIFRGYIQSRLSLFTTNSVLPILISSIIFAMAHWNYHSLKQILLPFFIGLLYGAFYKKYGNIYVLIICHFIFDFLQFLLAIISFSS